jgi:hypothetical protein
MKDVELALLDIVIFVYICELKKSLEMIGIIVGTVFATPSRASPYELKQYCYYIILFFFHSVLQFDSSKIP